MVDSFIVPDIAQLQKLSETIASLTSELGSRKYSTVLSTGSEQLFLVKNGNPIIGYSTPPYDESLAFRVGTELIERFIDNFENFKHVVMLYDDPALARRFEFQYSKIGLLKGERCMYLISEDDVESPESIRKQMDSFGIDTSQYMSNDCLKFVRIPDPAKDPRGFISGCQKIVGSLPQDQSTLPIRIVANMRYQVTTKEEIEGHSAFEKFVDSNFASFHGSVLCNHYIGNYSVETHGDWVRKMLQTHDVSLVVGSKKTNSFVFQNS